MKINNQESVLERVVANDVCVGCGMCAAYSPNELRMVTTELGEYQPRSIKGAKDSSEWQSRSLSVCPFSGETADEDELAKELYGKIDKISHREECGYFLQTYAGHQTDDRARLAATSGGIITWVAKYMLDTGEVDAVVCVGATDSEDRLFDYQFVEKSQDLERCKKSRYYPVEVSAVIPRIKASDKRVLFIGLPCFIKSLRLAMRLDPVLESRVVHTIGLVCGHLKTKKYAAYLARHCDVLEQDIESVDFRRKVAGRLAHQYAFEVKQKADTVDATKSVMMKKVWASSWGNNLFMLKACETCDDVFAETADLSVGDAWLNEFTGDYRGTSIILCRSEAMRDALQAGVLSGELDLSDLSIERVIQAQTGALRQRRDGLKYRLALARRNGQWRPEKRVEPDLYASGFLFRITQQLRLRIAQKSKDAYKKQEEKGRGLAFFKRKLWHLLFVSKMINFPRHLPGYCRRAVEILRGK